MRPIGRSRNAVRMLARYAIARTLQQRSLRQTLQVESSYLLCLRPTQLLAYGQKCVVLLNLSSGFKWNPNVLATIGQQPSLV
jgi:hypothetical protein